MVAQIPVPDEAVIARSASRKIWEIASDAASLRVGIANVMLTGPSLRGPDVAVALRDLARQFDQKTARPR